MDQTEHLSYSQATVAASVHKKRSMLVDALRFSGQHGEAATALAQHLLYHLQLVQEQRESRSEEQRAARGEVPSNAADGVGALSVEDHLKDIPLNSLLSMWIKLKKAGVQLQQTPEKVGAVILILMIKQFLVRNMYSKHDFICIEFM